MPTLISVQYKYQICIFYGEAARLSGVDVMSGFESAPIYNMVVAELGGERRFGSKLNQRASGFLGYCFT